MLNGLLVGPSVINHWGHRVKDAVAEPKLVNSKLTVFLWVPYFHMYSTHLCIVHKLKINDLVVRPV